MKIRKQEGRGGYNCPERKRKSVNLEKRRISRALFFSPQNVEKMKKVKNKRVSYGEIVEAAFLWHESEGERAKVKCCPYGDTKKRLTSSYDRKIIEKIRQHRGFANDLMFSFPIEKFKHYHNLLRKNRNK